MTPESIASLVVTGLVAIMAILSQVIQLRWSARLERLHKAEVSEKDQQLHSKDALLAERDERIRLLEEKVRLWSDMASPALHDAYRRTKEGLEELAISLKDQVASLNDQLVNATTRMEEQADLYASVRDELSAKEQELAHVQDSEKRISVLYEAARQGLPSRLSHEPSPPVVALNAALEEVAVRWPRIIHYEGLSPRNDPHPPTVQFFAAGDRREQLERFREDYHQPDDPEHVFVWTYHQEQDRTWTRVPARCKAALLQMSGWRELPMPDTKTPDDMIANWIQFVVSHAKRSVPGFARSSGHSAGSRDSFEMIEYYAPGKVTQLNVMAIVRHGVAELRAIRFDGTDDERMQWTEAVLWPWERANKGSR